MYQKYFSRLESLFNYKSKNENVNQILKRGFCYSEFQNNKLLFIGINPSYLPNANIESHHYCIKKASQDYPKYFGKFQELVNKTKYENDWTYIDLFNFRETDQNKIKYFINNDLDFIVEHLKLTNEIINEINPEVIVVCNSGASNFFGINEKQGKNVWLGFDFYFNEDFGVEIMNGIKKESILNNMSEINNLVGKPFLFSSILTYLDIHSKKRLNWIIKRIGENF